MSDWFDDEDVNARVSTTFTCEHNRNGCPLCAEKVFEQAGEIAKLRKQLEDYKGEMLAAIEKASDHWRRSKYGQIGFGYVADALAAVKQEVEKL